VVRLMDEEIDDVDKKRALINEAIAFHIRHGD
jgi:hypothetical protein